MTRSYSSLFFWLVMTIGASLMLYHTSDKVHALDVQLRTLNAQIEDQQKSLHVLKAEWAYLTNPARIETKAKRHLALKPTESRRIAGLQNLSDLLPLQDASPGVTLAKTNAQPAQQAESAKTVVSGVASVLANEERNKPRTKHERVLALLNEGRINDRMTMQHAAVADAKPDRIDALMGKLGFRP